MNVIINHFVYYCKPSFLSENFIFLRKVTDNTLQISPNNFFTYPSMELSFLKATQSVAFLHTTFRIYLKPQKSSSSYHGQHCIILKFNQNTLRQFFTQKDSLQYLDMVSRYVYNDNFLLHHCEIPTTRSLVKSSFATNVTGLVGSKDLVYSIIGLKW